MNLYRVRKGGSHKNAQGEYEMTYVISVPKNIGKRLHGRQFAFSLTSDGILYRPVDQDGGDPSEPEWVQDA